MFTEDINKNEGSRKYNQGKQFGGLGANMFFFFFPFITNMSTLMQVLRNLPNEVWLVT